MADEILSVLQNQAAQQKGLDSGEGRDRDFMNWETYLYQDSGLKDDPQTEALGYGVERCLYELNPELPCMTPYFSSDSVMTPGQAILALEKVASETNRPLFPIDRHLAAFLMSRWKEMSFLAMRDMGKPQREIRNLAALKMLTALQEQFKIRQLPNLCNWLAELCQPILGDYRNIKVRNSVQERIAQAIKAGSLRKLLQVLEDKQAASEDQYDYRAAKIEILLIESEIKEIKSKILNQNRGVPHTIGLLGRVYACFYKLRNLRSTHKGRTRIAQLYEKSENIRET